MQQLSCSAHLKKTGHERQKDKSTHKKTQQNYEIIPTPVPPPTPWYESTTTHLSHPRIIHNNNKMDTEFLVQMKQSNKCGSVRNNEIFNLHLGSGTGPWVSIPCLLKDTSHLTINLKKAKNPEMRFNSQQIVSYGLGLCTQNPGLRQVDWEPSPKRGSDKINMLK